MKVSDAKQKVCPFMSLNGIDRNGIAYVVKSKCICGDCMAWKFTKTHASIKTEAYVYDTGMIGNRRHEKRYREHELKEDEKEGYCARIGNE